MTKNTKNYRHLILSLTIATVFTLGVVAISNTSMATAEDHLISSTGGEFPPTEYATVQLGQVDCAVDVQPIVAMVTSNGFDSGNTVTLTADLTANGFTVRDLDVTGGIPACVTKLYISSESFGSCLTTSFTVVQEANIVNWIVAGGEAWINGEWGIGCGFGTKSLIENFVTTASIDTNANGPFVDGADYNSAIPATATLFAGVGSYVQFAGTHFVDAAGDPAVVVDTGNHPVMVAGPAGDGCVVIFGDSNWPHDGFINTLDNRRLANNAIAFINECNKIETEKRYSFTNVEFSTCISEEEIIDADGIDTETAGTDLDVEVRCGDPLLNFPDTGLDAGLDWFDNDGSLTWTAGDDLHVEDPSACPTGIRDGIHQLGEDCKVLDVDNSLSTGQPVNCDISVAFAFGGFPGANCPDPHFKFHDLNGNGAWSPGEDIVYDANLDNIFGEQRTVADANFGESLPFVDDKFQVKAVVHDKSDKVKSYNPGQYYAVTKVNISDDLDSLWILEDDSKCTVDSNISKMNPNKVPGGAAVVFIFNDNVFDLSDELADSGNLFINVDGNVEAHLDNLPADSEVLLYVKYGPGLKNQQWTGMQMCENWEFVNAVLVDGTQVKGDAHADLRVIRK